MELSTLYLLAYALTWETMTGKTPKNLAFTGNFLSKNGRTVILNEIFKRNTQGNSNSKWNIYLPSSLTLTVTLYKEQMNSSPHDNWHLTMSFNKWSTAPWSTKAWAWWAASA